MTNDATILATTRSIERDAVRLDGLRRRADLNDCYGLVQRRINAHMYAVRVFEETIIAKYANFEFVGDAPPPVQKGSTVDDPMSWRKSLLVLDDDMFKVYTSVL